MTVTVGTDVYDTVANVDTYWSDRGNTSWAALTTANKEIHMRKATDWLERNFRWRGTRATDDQRLGWPRNYAYDDDNVSIGTESAPWQVKEALAIVADLFRDGSYNLTGIVTRSTRIKRQKVDVIETEYEGGSSGQDTLTHVYQLLRAVSQAPGVLLRA